MLSLGLNDYFHYALNRDYLWASWWWCQQLQSWCHSHANMHVHYSQHGQRLQVHTIVM